MRHLDWIKLNFPKHGSIMHWFFYCMNDSIVSATGYRPLNENNHITWIHMCPDRDREAADYGWCLHCNVGVPKQVKMLAELRINGDGLKK